MSFESCPQDREWLDWATERWVELDSDTPEARALLNEIFRECGRQWLRRDPRRLLRRDVLRRRDPQSLRDALWERTRTMLRRQGVTLRSVPAGRQVAWPFAEARMDPLTSTDSYGDDLRSWAEKVQAKDVSWLRSQCDLHAIEHWLSPESRAALQEPPASSLPDYINHAWRESIAKLGGSEGAT